MRNFFDKHPYFCLTLFALCCFWPGLRALPVIDRDEAHFAQASRQMLETHQFAQIRFQEKTRFQKPPGINWLQAMSVSAFNAPLDTIWLYRIPSLLGALGAVLLTFFFGQTLIPRRFAAIAAALLASSLLVVVEAHMAVTDAALLCSIVLMQGALWRIYQASVSGSQVSRYWVIAFWGATAAGILLKGVSPLFSGLTILALCVTDRQVRWLRNLSPVLGLLGLISVTALWLAWVNHAEHSNYLLQMFQRDLLPKLQGGHESHGKPPLFHLFILPITAWPLSLFLAFGAIYAWRHRREPAVKFLIAWCLPTWIFFELMPTKLPQYVLPLFPAIALLCAGGIRELRLEKRFLVWGWALLTCVFGGVLAGASYYITHHISLPAVLIVILMVLIALWGLRWVPRTQSDNNTVRPVILVLAGSAMLYTLTFSYLLPAWRPVWLTQSIAAEAVDAHLTAKHPLLVYGFEEPSLVFLLGTHCVQFMESKAAWSSLISVSHAYILADATHVPHWAYRVASNISTFKGLRYSKGREIALVWLTGRARPAPLAPEKLV